MILLLLFDAGVTSEEVIPDHEYWISFMVQYQKEKEYVEKYSPALQFVSSIVTKRVYFFSAHFIFHFAGPERVSVAYQSAGAGGIEDGMEDDGTEGGRSWMGVLGQI